MGIWIQAPGLKLGMCGEGIGCLRAQRSAGCGLRVAVEPPLGKERGIGTSVLHTADLEIEYLCEIQS